MSESFLTHLHLRAPIFYEKIICMAGGERETLQNYGELLFCYDIDPDQGGSIEPRSGQFLGGQVFAGRKRSGGAAGENSVSLPEGLYLFTQARDFLEKEQWLEMAVEQQKDGLWERNKLINTLYVRYLLEDGSAVTQALRPVL
jgi:hypothetical protein